MATGQVNRIVHHLRWIAHGSEDRARSDGQLLEGFVSRQDEAAFEELVRRHGPMVLGVCKRMLSNVHDAEDAFQATFMVLVRRARSVAPRELVGNWLYGVACRVALHAQTQAGRRRAREKQVEDMPHPTAPPADTNSDLRPLLDLELSRLPEKYRVPIVLCDLEGRSRKDVARKVGIPEGTLSSRLATGRKMLAQRLTRHGLSIGAAGSAGAILEGTAQAAVPGPLAVATVKAAVAGAAKQAVAAGALSTHAAALTEGVMKAMLISKLKAMIPVVLALGLFTTGAGMMTLTADESGAGGGFTQAKGGSGVDSDKPAVNLPARFKIVLEYADDETQETGDGAKKSPPPIVDRKVVTGQVDPKAFDRLDVIHSQALRDIVNCAACHLEVSRQPQRTRVYELLSKSTGKAPGGGSGIGSSSSSSGSGSNSSTIGSAGSSSTIRSGSGSSSRTIGTGSSISGSSTSGSSGDIIIIRVPKKGSPATDAEFLRRVCLDLLGRLPSPLETHYFLKDNDTKKYHRAVEKLIENQGPTQVAPAGNKAPPLPKAADRTTRAEDYVKQKLGRNQLSPEERQLVQKALEFADKDRTPPIPPTPPPVADPYRGPGQKALVPPKD